ncbi:MBL fold metallo-hydrolase RNA specificity domain-containing protein [Robiginitalea sp. SC105]|uniref:MBL fold metallo-hydrolase RNA specificity domain-containing protein n=1 Tax=Robiginitalea sp. SC105 TaxID=2762332 RepID=UPI00163AAEDE|nr:MBL fold metallo-hydrolase [Robiginitalea sp. SC105]MBC2840049.1 MBL fold metallo-hydrolase [Robiginitalea sp. SC105]
MKAKLQFWGAAGCVTGSKYLLEYDGHKVLVDCGMFQGLKALRLLNRATWPSDPAGIHAVVLTHGHLDHVGLLPRLVRDGFRGEIYGTTPTLAIARIVLEDSAKIQVEEAERAREEGYSRHAEPEPLYTPEDVEACLRLFVQTDKDRWYSLPPKAWRFRMRYNGHILGACFVEMELGATRAVFSGDIGRPADPLLFPPERPRQAEVLLLESTYGNRLHPGLDMEEALASEINGTIADRGTCIIPCFAVERLQVVMLLLLNLRRRNRIPRIQVYVDSPMGSNVLELFGRFPEWHKLSPKDFHAMKAEFTLIESYRDTWNAIDDSRPKVVIAGSGMLSGGRVLAYLSQLLDRTETRILLMGYQAEGTRGRNLLDGAHELKIFGKYVPVKAMVRHYESLSAHADQSEILWWISELEKAPDRVFLIHGEPTARDALRVKLRDTRGWIAELPEMNEEIIL